MIKKSILECLRTPVKCAVLMLIFTATFTGLCFAVNYDNYVQTNISEIDKSFTTIACPNVQEIYSFLPSPYTDEKIDYTLEGDLYLSLRHFVEGSENGRLDNSELLRGVCEDATPVLSGTFDPLEYDSNADLPCNAAAFIVTAKEVEYVSSAVLERGIISSGGTNEGAHYIIKFRVDETVILNSSYQSPEFIYVSSGAFTSDLRCPFEYGKQYFISGVYYDVDIIQKERDNGTPFSEYYLEPDEDSVPSMYLDGSNFLLYPNMRNGDREPPDIKDIEVNGEATTVNTYSEKELSQMCVPYEGDMEALLVKRPDIAERLESVKANANTIEIRTTENLNSVLYFNQGKASVMAGRNFTEKEIESGTPVCVVSERFATYNKLEIGDSINVDLYNPLMKIVTDMGVRKMTPYHDTINPRLHEREVPRGSLKLKIVGIYITKPWEYNAYALSDNTVFIPSGAVPVKSDLVLPEKLESLDEVERRIFSVYSTYMMPSLLTAIIPNNKLDAFKTEAAEAGFGKYFIYNDQGFSSIKETLPVIAESTQVFVTAALIGFLAVFVLYLILLPRKLQGLGMLISLGAKRREAVKSVVFGWIIIIIPAQVLSFMILILTSVPLTKAALNATMNQLQYNSAFSAGAQEGMTNLSTKFNAGTNHYGIILIMILGTFTLYLVTAYIFYLVHSKRPALKLLRRRE